MARKKKSLDELDDELAALEAELEALEGGDTPAAPEPEPQVEPPAEAPEPTDQPDEPAEGRRGGLKRLLPFGGGDDETDEPDDASEDDEGSSEVEAPDADTNDAPARRRSRLPFGRKRAVDDDVDAGGEADAAEAPPPDAASVEDGADAAEAPPPEAAVEPAQAHSPPSEGRAGRWEREGDRWVRREDAEPNDEDAAEAGPGLFSRFRRRDEEDVEDDEPVEADDERVEEDEEEEERSTKWPLILLLLLVGIVIIAVIAWLLLGMGGAEPDATFTVQANTAPNSGATYALAGTPVTFDASGTSDATSYAWDFGDGSEPVEGSEPTATHTYASRGTFTVTLTAGNDDGTSTHTQQLDVIAVPTAAVAAMFNGSDVTPAGPGDNNVFVGDQVQFDATASQADPNQTISEYRWDFDEDGTVDDQAAQATHAFGEAGMHVVKLTVVDDLGNEAEAQYMLHVGTRTSDSGTVGLGAIDGAPASADVPVPVDQGRTGVQPAQVEIVLTWNPGQAFVNTDLNLTILDADGAVVTVGVPDGDTTIEVVVSNPDAFTIGTWTARIQRADPTGAGDVSLGGQDVEYTLEARVIY